MCRAITEAAEAHWSGYAAAAMENIVMADKSLDMTIEGFSWSGESLATELDFVTQVIADAAGDNSSVLVWQPVDRQASAPAALKAVNAGLKMLWVDEFVVGYQDNGIGMGSNPLLNATSHHVVISPSPYVS